MNSPVWNALSSHPFLTSYHCHLLYPLLTRQESGVCATQAKWSLASLFLSSQTEDK
jgi:hypothetical protein